MKRVAVLGLGSWGTSLAIRLAARGVTVLGWTRREDARQLLRARRENVNYLPNNEFPDLLQVLDSPKEAVRGAEAVIMAVPSHALREIATGVRDDLGGRLVINLAKGLEEGSGSRMLEVLEEVIGRGDSVSLVGPSHAEEVVLGFPTAVVATSSAPEAAEATQRLFVDESFRVYTNGDVIGVEIAVALKNVIALAAGVSAGLGYGDNTLGSLITRGLAEMTRLGVSLGANRETFFGLAGVGDLVTTCGSRHSRNRRVGERIGKGDSLSAAQAAVGMVAEGVRTTAVARELATARGIEMPIVEQVHEVLFREKAPRAALRDLMAREPKPE